MATELLAFSFKKNSKNVTFKAMRYRKHLLFIYFVHHFWNPSSEEGTIGDTRVQCEVSSLLNPSLKAHKIGVCGVIGNVLASSGSFTSHSSLKVFIYLPCPVILSAHDVLLKLQYFVATDAIPTLKELSVV